MQEWAGTILGTHSIAWFCQWGNGRRMLVARASPKDMNPHLILTRNGLRPWTSSGLDTDTSLSIEKSRATIRAPLSCTCPCPVLALKVQPARGMGTYGPWPGAAEAAAVPLRGADVGAGVPSATDVWEAVKAARAPGGGSSRPSLTVASLVLGTLHSSTLTCSPLLTLMLLLPTAPLGPGPSTAAEASAAAASACHRGSTCMRAGRGACKQHAHESR